MPARPNPTADLARMYRERIPTAPLSNYDKVIQSRLAPHRFTGGSSGLGFLAPVGNFLKTAVESLDPRFIASEGGRSVEHVYGDAKELAKSVVTGEDTLSQSPSARAYQAAGGGFGGALAAALPYVNVATAVVPTTKLLTPAGRAALGADAAEKLAQRQIAAIVPEPPIGIHVSPRSGLETINPRVVGGGQSTAADALAGSSYMWDARSPETYANIFDNPQMAEMTGLGNPPPSLYVTQPRGPVFQDANVPMSSSLRVQGPQTVIGEVPFTREALQEYLRSIGVSPRSATADRLEQAYRGLSPTVQAQVANRPAQMAEERLRAAIRQGIQGRSLYSGLSNLDPAAPLDELLDSRMAENLYNEWLAGGTPTRTTAATQAPQPTIGINEIDDILSDIRASRPESTPSQLPGVSEPLTSGMPRGVYAVDDASGNVVLYQLDDTGAVQGKLEMKRTMDGFTVGSLSANPGSPAVANLLAGAKITADLNFPGVQYPLSPSANLSQYSRPIVEKLQAAGLIDPNYILPPSRLLNTIDRPFGLEAPIPVQDVPRLVGISPEQIRSTSRELIRALAEAKRQGRISPDTITRTAQLRSELAARMAAAGMTPATPGATPSVPITEMLIGNEYYAVPRGFELSPLFRDILAKQDQFYLSGIMDELGEQYVNFRWNNPYEISVA